MLNEQESLLLALAHQYLQNLLPVSVMQSMEGFFFQTRSNLADAERSTPESLWLRKVRVVIATQPLMPARIHSDVFEAVTPALYRNL